MKYLIILSLLLTNCSPVFESVEERIRLECGWSEKYEFCFCLSCGPYGCGITWVPDKICEKNQNEVP